MSPLNEGSATRIVAAVHGRAPVSPDPDHEIGLAADLAGRHTPAEIMVLFRRFNQGDDHFDEMMRRVCVRAVAKRCGHNLRIGPNVGLRHPETFEIGDGVFIGEQTIIQGRFDGRCVIGDKVWIGPQSFLDARDLVIGDHVGWAPGAKVLGSAHTGVPLDLPIIATDLRIAPVHVDSEADIGVNAVLLPGVTIGRGAMVGAGAVVTRDVPPYSKVAGVPARVIGHRDGKNSSEGAPL